MYLSVCVCSCLELSPETPTQSLRLDIFAKFANIPPTTIITCSSITKVKNIIARYASLPLCFYFVTNSSVSIKLFDPIWFSQKNLAEKMAQDEDCESRKRNPQMDLFYERNKKR